MDDGLADDGGGGGAVSGDIVRLGSDLAGELSADVLERVLQLDVFGDGDAVVSDRWGAEFLLQDDVATLRAKGDLYGVGEGIDTGLHSVARGLIEQKLFGHSD